MGMIVGYEKEKKTISQLRDMLHKAELYREHGIRIPRGLELPSSDTAMASKPVLGSTFG